jgi:hypothetical protein
MTPSARLVRSGVDLGQGGHTSPRALGNTPLTEPYIDPAIVEYLDMVFPDKVSFAVSRGLAEARAMREVIDHLRSLSVSQRASLPREVNVF